MKVIELLTKIANGEEAPKKIKYKDNIFIAKGNGINGFVDYVCEEIDYCFSHYIDWDNLNDEVEIIEEDKKIEKIPKKDKNGDIYLYSNEALEIIDKLNEIIDYINKEK